MAEKTETPKVPQHLLSDDESRKWKVVDIAVVSPTRVTALLQNNQEWCIDTFDYNEKEYQRIKRICLQTTLKEPPLLLSYVHVEDNLKHFVCTKKKLHLIDDVSESIEKSVSLSAEPSAICVEDNKVYISTNETKTLMFFKLELPKDTSKIYLNDISKHDSIAEFVVHSKNIYVCTKRGKVSSYKETGEKQHDYRNRKSKNSKARGLAVFTPQGKDSNLLLVTWSDNTLYIYSTKSHHDLLDIDLNVPGKIRVTTSCFLMSSEVNDVAVYNMKTVADRGAFKMILVSGSREEDLSYLIDYVLHDTTEVVLLSRNFLIKRRNLTTLVEMYDYSCLTNDNLNAEKKKLKDEIERSKKEKDDLTVDLKNARSNLSRKEADLSDVKAKLDDARTGRDELRIMNEEKEEKCCSLSKQLEAERKTTEELKDEIDRCKREKDDLTKELENTRSKLSTKEADLLDVKATLDDARTESDELRIMNEGKEEKCFSLTKQLESERKTTEELMDEIDRRKKEKDDLTEELENTRSKLSRKEADLSDVKATLDDARTESDELRIMNGENEEKCSSLTKQLEAERKKTEELMDEIDRSEKEKDDVTEELENTRSNLSRKKAELSDVKAKLDDARTESDELRIMNEEKEEKCDCLTEQLQAERKATDEARTESDDLRRMNKEKEETCCSLTKQLEAERKKTEELKNEIDRCKKEKDDVTEEFENTRSNLSRKEANLSDVKVKLDEGDTTKDIYADSAANMETGLKDLIDRINDDTVKLERKVEDVTKELKITNLTLKKKEEEYSQIQNELDAAISQKKELEKKTAMETDTLKQIIEFKDKEIQGLKMRLHTAVTDLKNTERQVKLLRDKQNELVESVSKEQNRSEELQALLANLEDANYHLRKEHDKAEETQTLLSKLKHEIDRIKKEKDDLTEELEKTRTNLSRKEADLSNVKAKFDKTKTESETLRRMNEEKEEKCDCPTKQLEAKRNTTEGLKDEIDRSKTEKGDVAEELENTRSNLSRKEADFSDVKAKLDDAKTESNDLRRKNEENEEICRSLTKQLEAERKATEEGRITKDTIAVSTENMKTGPRGLIYGILDDLTMELTKQKNDVTEELEITKSTLTKKEEDRSQIQVELDAAISNKMDLEKTVTKSEEQYRIIQAKEREIQQLRMRLKKAQTEVENAKTQVTILQDRKQELEKSLSREQERSKEVEKLFLNINERINELEFTRKKLERQQTKLEDNLVQEKQKVARKERSRVKLNETIKELKLTGKNLESQVKKSKDNLDQENGKVTREERSRVQLNERINELEFTRKKLERQQKKLEDNLVQEKQKVAREERSRVQMVANLKKVEERNKKLENAMTQLKEKLFAEGMTAKKLQTASPKILETQANAKRIPRDENLQGVMHSMKGNIKRLGEEFSKSKAVLNGLEKSTVEQEADNMQLTLELSNVSDDTILQDGQESVSFMVESAFDEMEEEVMKLEEKIEKLEGSLSKKEASFKALDTSNKKLSEECERLSKEVALARFLSDSSKFGASQRYDRDPYWFNDADPVISESKDSGVATSNLETDDCLSGLFTEKLDQFCPALKVAVTVSSKGTQMLIPDTGVELYVPGGSLLSRQLIELKVIDFDNDKFDALFSLDSNSSVAVQLLPNKATLRWPARLRLPHCLRLKANFHELKSHVKIYRSEHAPGQDAQWEHDPELKYELKEDCCIIFVKKFCSLRYDVIDEAIDATNVTVFTSWKQHGTSTELAVGYHVDLPGRREMLLTMNNDMKIFKAKPFEFVKESTDTLQVHLTTAVSRAQSYEKATTEVDGKLSVFEAAAKIAELPLDRPKPLHLSDASHIEGYQHISTAMLKVSETVSNKRTTMRILDTGIELDIPPNAFQGYRYIEMSVVPFGTLDEPISTFSSNSSVIVELLPNRATFSTPVRLSLPHCLKLKKGFSKRSVKVYLSHHEKDQKPFWEELPDAKYELKADHCVLYLTSFCWVKYEIDNKIVVAKRIKVYTATRGMEQNDQIAEVEVGYFIDMPGRAENLRENVDLKISQCKPLLFFKEGNLPLQIFLIKVLPMFWKYSTPDRNPKVIPYKSIADSLDTSLPFVFEKQDANEQKPFAMFRVSQGIEEVEINIRL